MISAILNSRHIYGWPAWAPVMNNLVTIAAALLFLLVPGPANLTTATITDTQILILGIGTTLGIAAQALMLLVPLRRSGFAWRWRFRASPNEAGRMAEFRTLMLWVLGYVVISQVGVVVINRVANEHGGVQIFAYADLLFMVPYGVLGVSLLTALMPRMSRAAARGDTAAVLADLQLGSRLSAVALVPISAGLMVFGPLFTSVILLNRFSQSNARLTGVALAAGAFGLLPFAVVMLQQRVFYAMRDARTPTFINLAMVATKVSLVLAGSLLLHGRAVLIALTVSTSTSYLVGCLVGHQLLRRRFGELRFTPVLPDHRLDRGGVGRRRPGGPRGGAGRHRGAGRRPARGAGRTGGRRRGGQRRPGAAGAAAAAARGGPDRRRGPRPDRPAGPPRRDRPVRPDRRRWRGIAPALDWLFRRSSDRRSQSAASERDRGKS